ncbi:transglycosylase domain-containing protein [Actinomadura sp. NPDC047616]|uniref:transglycosylase domain-containing protein n=1 Tax=Actinomadura sp. NPDC047616 TaxID=3155914 RepID=UPI0033C44CEC
MRAGRPRHARTRPKHSFRLPRFLRGGRGLLAAVLSCVLPTATAIAVLYVRTPLPTEPQAGAADEGSTVYYGDGRTPMFRLGANREVVRHHQIPDHLRWAVLAAEDRGFYTGHGVSPKAMLRALMNNASGGDMQGASTITQQLARNYYKGLSRDRTLGRKVKELVVAVKMNRDRPKDEILDLYLNTVYFGRQTSGVQAAARAFFDKDVWQLTVAESALLAAMIQRPEYFRTQGDDAPARALRARWKYVVDGMVAMGRLERAAADRLRFPRTRREWQGVNLTGQDLLVRQRVLDELETLGIPAQSVVNGRLKIYTGLDRRWMAYAEQAMRRAREPEWPQRVRGGLIAVDPADGTVRALYGGDPERTQHDSLFTPVAQAASGFKPYVLAAALRRGYSVRSVVNGDAPQKFAPDGSLTPLSAPGYLVDNDEKIGSVGRVDLATATALSVNTGYVKLAFEAGLSNVVDTAVDLGFPAEALKPFRGQAGIALGIADISAAHQAAGYAAFANGGTPVTPHLITKIVDARGRTVPLPWTRPRRRVLTTEQAAQVTYALRRTVTTGTGRDAALPDREAAGKTGSTDRHRAAWFVGYVPQLSTAVVMADTQGRTLRNLPGHPGEVSGETGPTRIWRSFMEKATRDLPVEPFPTPAFTGEAHNWDTDPQHAPPPATRSSPSASSRAASSRATKPVTPRPESTARGLGRTPPKPSVPRR